MAQGELRPIGLIPHNLFYLPQGTHINRVGPKGIKAHWVNQFQYFTGCKATIAIDSAQGGLRPIGFIPSSFRTGCK